jgi:uncharacterized repeat protein (TIGR03806 family)
MIQPAFPQLRLFQSLVGLFQAPGDNAWWYGLQRHGRILRFANDPTVTRKSIVLDIEHLVNAEGEGGLLGMAFHPNFATNGQVFLHYTGHGAPQVTYISRFTSTDGGATLDPASEQVILDFPQNNIRHKGGHIAFGPDGYLYISHGDGGNKSEAQNTDNWFGTLLRIDVDNGIPYAIPPDNPFAAGGGAPEIYAWGFRNPWRWSFDRATGAIWLGDVGAESWEEINRVKKGGNYGWPIREGKHCFPPEVESCSTADLIDPIVEYPHDEGPTAVIGGYVYRGRAIPALRGIYLYANYSTATIWGIFRDQDGNPTSRLLTDGGVGTIWSFAEDQEGEVYLAASGRIGRLVPAPAAEEDNTFPQLLSATGCVDPNYPTEPAPGLIPYDVQVPFWSDGAQKRRWIALPEGTTIHIGADGDWELPIGTVLMKRFRLGGRLIETRLLVRHADGGWAGYSYEWNDDQTDATLLPGGKTKIINGQSYAIPSRTQCIQCHNAEAGYTLGLETLQMNRGYKYPTAVSGWLNQMRVYEHMGLFDTPLSVPPRDLPSLPRTTNEHARLARRARAYLHANCAYCHRPEGLGQGPADFLFQTTEMGVCDVPPTVDDFGIPEARLLAPGDPAKSIISLRLHALDSSRMPPIGKHVVDSDGVALIDAWITSLRSCP